MNKNLEELNQLINKFFLHNQDSSLNISVSINDIHQLYSLGNIQKDNFGIGSISKTFFASYLSYLENQKRIDMTKSLNDYLDLNPKFNYPSLHELATHTSGYRKLIPLTKIATTYLFHGYNGKNLYQGTSREWIMRYLRNCPPIKKKIYCYSDFNYVLLSFVIETIEKKPCNEILLDYINNTLNLSSTIYYDDLTSKNDIYSWTWESQNPFLISGGISSNIQDLSKYLKYQIDHQNELSSSLAKYHPTHANHVFTGYSWNSFYNGDFYWHSGGQGRYRSYVLFDSKRKITIVILSIISAKRYHVTKIGSSIYRNLKRNPQQLSDFLTDFNPYV